MKQRKSQELPFEQSQDALTTSAPRWVCDKCHAVAFDEYETAVAHEKICKGPGKVLATDTNANADSQQDQEVAAKHENISKKRGLDLTTNIICVEDPRHDQDAAVAHKNISKKPGLDLTVDISADLDQEAASAHENISKERGLDLTTDISVDDDQQQDQSQTICPPAKKRLRKKSPEKLKEQYSQNTLVDSNLDQDNEAPGDEIYSKTSEDYSIDANVDVNDSSDNGEDDDSSKDVPSTPPRKLPPPTVSGSSVDFHLEPVRPHLICSLCDGYFRDPYTITECLHSFCKSCLFYAFAEGFRDCPRCQISLSPDPKKKVLSDRTLQEVVDTLFPDLKEKDEEDEKAFYAQRGIQLQEEYRVDTKVTQNSGTIACISTFQSQMRSQIPVTQMSQRKVSVAQHDELTFKLVPHKFKPRDKSSRNKSKSRNSDELPPLEKPLLRTSGKLRVVQLKKYLILHLGLDTSPLSGIEILCDGDPIGDELSLVFVKRTRFRGDGDLVLTYRYEQDRGQSFFLS